MSQVTELVIVLHACWVPLFLCNETVKMVSYGFAC